MTKVYTEARNRLALSLAREAVKTAVRATGNKLGHYHSADIDKAAIQIYNADTEHYNKLAEAKLDLSKEPSP